MIFSDAKITFSSKSITFAGNKSYIKHHTSSMFTVIGIMFIGIGLGYLLRRQSLPWINKVITALIWLLLFLLGIEVGQNERIIRSLPTLGVEAFVIAIVCVLGRCVTAWGLWKYVNGRKEEVH